MNSRPFLVLPALVLSLLASCEKAPTPVQPAVVDSNATAEQLAGAHDALQRQALEIETRTALMDKQLAEMEQALREHENAELRRSLEGLKQQNDDLRVQADEARRRSEVIIPAPVVTPMVDEPADIAWFEGELAPHGRWLEVKGYGRSWRPTITVPNWRPYVDGCWEWSSMGWTWQSNEPFGWIVYHYGRWVNALVHGWVWVPGVDWAPAWVAWRQSSDCVGWAPLPPDPGPMAGVYRDCDSAYGLGPSNYVFITLNQFILPSYKTVCAPVTRNAAIFQQSVNVTQIVRQGGADHGHFFVHHGGPPRTQIEQACARPAPEARPFEHPRSPSRLRDRPRSEGTDRSHASVVVERPAKLDEPRSPSREHTALPWAGSRPSSWPMPGSKPLEAGSILPVVEQRAKAEGPSHGRSDRQQPGSVPGWARRTEVTQNHPTTVEIRSALPPSPLTEVPPGLGTPNRIFGPPPRVGQNNVTSAAVVGRPRHEEIRHREGSSRPNGDGAVRIPSAPIPIQSPADSAARHPALGGITIAEPVQKVGSDDAVLARSRQMERRAVPSVTGPEPQPQTPDAAPTSVQSVAEAGVRQEPAAIEMPRINSTPAQEREGHAHRQSGQMTSLRQEGYEVRQQAEAQRRGQEDAGQAQEMQQRREDEQMRQRQEVAQRQAEAVAVQQRAQADMAQTQAMAQRQADEQARVAADQQALQQLEMAQQQAQEEARRQAEAEMRRAQEEAQRQAEEQARRAQEMAQQQAQEEARRQAEAEMRRAQEAAQRQAEEQARRAQEMAQREAEEQARRAGEEARRAQEEAARAAQEAARNQPSGS